MGLLKGIATERMHAGKTNHPALQPGWLRLIQGLPAKPEKKEDEEE